MLQKASSAVSVPLQVYEIDINVAKCCIRFYVSSILIQWRQLLGEKCLICIVTNPVAYTELLIGKEIVR